MLSKDAIKLYVVGIALLALTAWVFFRENRTDWSDYQAEFRDMVAEKFGEERANQVPSGIQQIWVKDLDRVDRCITCHQAVEWKGLENAPEPYRTHPKEILEKHSLTAYGCTSCHGGQGFSTTLPDAHGNVEHWDEPVLGAEIREAYLIKDTKALMQINCNACHRYDRETKGMDLINMAKSLVNEKNCRACHTINGRGGIIGPDLTAEGDKPTEQFDYSRLSGRHSVFEWQVTHLQNPKMVSPDTVMPNFGFTSLQAQALSLLVMSWRKNFIPAHYISGVQLRDVPTQAEIDYEKRMLEGEGAFFVKNNCFICHSVSSFGIESASKIGPDLADAVTDVQSRFGRTLDDFLMEPTGTMSVVLATQIPLTKEQRQQAIALLKVAHQRKLEQQIRKASPSPTPTGK
jgi:cytochrome c2